MKGDTIHMRKLIILLLLGVLALGILPAVSAAPVGELTMLAQYFPDTTGMFVAIRSDDALFAEWDSLIAKVASKLPPGTIPSGITLQSLLDLGAQQFTGTDFASGIRSWLGDTIAVGGQSFVALAGTSPQIVAAVEITDRAAAESFVDRLARLGNFERSTQPPDGYTMYESIHESGGAVLIGDNVLFAAPNEAAVKTVLNVSSSLSGSDKFNTALNLLPADSYHLVAYVDVGQLSTMLGPQMAGVVNSEIIGLTVLDGDTLALDIAADLGDTSALSDVLGYTMPQLGPVDPAFANHIPGDASFVIHASNLKEIVNSYLNALLLSGRSPDSLIPEERRDELKTQIQAATGLDIDADVLDWMTGDFALWMRIDLSAIMDMVVQGMSAGTGGTAAAPNLDDFSLGFGLAIEATDAAKAQNLATVLGNLLTQYSGQMPNTTISSDQISGTDVTVVSATDASSGMTFEMVMGANDNIFFIADRTSAAAILSGDGTLAQSQTFADAGRYLLPNPTSVVYFDENGVFGNPVFMVVGLTLLGPSIGNVFDTIVADLEGTPTAEELARRQEAQRRQEEQQRQLLAIFQSVTAMFESGSMSGASTSEGDAVFRFALTLAE
jgi:hypothetical protein